jgi:hypothetical protein
MRMEVIVSTKWADRKWQKELHKIYGEGVKVKLEVKHTETLLPSFTVEREAGESE